MEMNIDTNLLYSCLVQSAGAIEYTKCASA